MKLIFEGTPEEFIKLFEDCFECDECDECDEEEELTPQAAARVNFIEVVTKAASDLIKAQNQ